MGLLDVLGQVLGGMAQQGGAGQAGGMGQMGRQAPGAPDIMDILSRMGGGQPGGMGGGLPGGMGMPGGAGMPQQMPGGAGMGGMAGGGSLIALIALAMQMLQQNGGLGNVLGQLQQQGQGDAVNSWVVDGNNTPVSPDILSQIFGREELGRAAREMGMSPDQAAGGLASVFPEIVNQMTPDGRVETGSNDVVAQALEMLRRQQRG